MNDVTLYEDRMAAALAVIRMWNRLKIPELKRIAEHIYNHAEQLRRK
jgi:hypothetical protein